MMKEFNRQSPLPSASVRTASPGLAVCAGYATKPLISGFDAGKGSAHSAFDENPWYVAWLRSAQEAKE